VSHMVIFQTPDGNPGYNQFETVEEAVSFVEKLRNDQGIDNARMFALEEIKFELRPVYRVELQALTQGASQGGQAFGSPPASGGPAAPDPAPQGQPVNNGSGSAFGSYPPPSPEPAYSPPSPPSDQPAGDEGQPARRGLFGR
jgi:hypothetical protein